MSKRVEELRKYLRENTYPAHQKNIMAAIEIKGAAETEHPLRLYPGWETDGTQC